jgi:hypothetical protein
MCHRSDRLPADCEEYAGGVRARPAPMLTQHTFAVYAIVASGRGIEKSG